MRRFGECRRCLQIARLFFSVIQEESSEARRSKRIANSANRSSLLPADKAAVDAGQTPKSSTRAESGKQSRARQNGRLGGKRRVSPTRRSPIACRSAKKRQRSRANRCSRRQSVGSKLLVELSLEIASLQTQCARRGPLPALKIAAADLALECAFRKAARRCANRQPRRIAAERELINDARDRALRVINFDLVAQSNALIKVRVFCGFKIQSNQQSQ